MNKNKSFLGIAMIEHLNVGVSNIHSLNEARGKGTGPEGVGGTDVCVCPQCKREYPHMRGTPCNQRLCKTCHVPLTGKGAPGEIKS
jgi:hypothetical protein